LFLLLNWNNFHGSPINDEIFSLLRLKRLYLSESNFSGRLSKELGNLKKLEEFYCSLNQLTGEIPPSIGNLERLKILDLSINELTGHIPPQLGFLPNIQSLAIDSNSLSGPVPDFSNLRFFNTLNLSYNRLTGTISKKFFTSVSDVMQTITINLKENLITGTVPRELSHLRRVNLDLSSNMITGISPQLCKSNEWMQGAVENIGCDAILCPPQTHNIHGKQLTKDERCFPCNSFSLPYYGSRECGSVQKQKEREILIKFYNSCGGDNWKRNDNWLKKNSSFCDWHGITCNEMMTTDSILLGSNNIVGTPPVELFELKELKWLWLYSNPLNFKFDGIGNATQLTSLLIDSTGLTSVKGIKDAKNLRELDLRFNQLTGEISSEFSFLQNLELLSLSENQLTGTLPNFLTNMTHLKKLRLRKNQISGSLLQFSKQLFLTSLDIAHNNITGTIPSNILEDTNIKEKVIIDLSSNYLSGAVPKELIRFENMNIFLRGNMISYLDENLCANELWNDGDVGQFGCDGIVCPKGTFSETGRQADLNKKCEKCEDSLYYGSTDCHSQLSSESKRLWPVAICFLSLAFYVIDL